MADVEFSIRKAEEEKAAARCSHEVHHYDKCVERLEAMGDAAEGKNCQGYFFEKFECLDKIVRSDNFLFLLYYDYYYCHSCYFFFHHTDPISHP